MDELMSKAVAVGKVANDKENDTALAVMAELQEASSLEQGPVRKLMLDDEYRRIGKMCFAYENKRFG